ncbi:MAG TPA: bifunctional 4-hydroxy-2-oxoglutarate aldolase/2-dehydro-3-deoxy-phosphogluconate aldolase [Verrucomicrobiae bacterium]|nr:bifunctional 4-hydroxy-2-oxoglutarate aldolase/2-dehydro-3-deoxy-phosphogluconate aldolase [Verrucomicrobiae bacterium]
MIKDQVRQRILEIGIVPVVRAASPQHAIAATRAVSAGGITVVEITMTVPGALDVIKELVSSNSQNLLVGAGTVMNAKAAQQCLDAGAEFLVSPGFDPATVKLANAAGKLIMAGALTPTEVMTAWDAGADFIKIFPCSAVGGASYIKALKGPMPKIPFIPTGGVNLKTAADFIRAGAAALGVGGELVMPSALASGDTKAITDLAKQFVALVREVRESEQALAEAKT